MLKRCEVNRCIRRYSNQHFVPAICHGIAFRTGCLTYGAAVREVREIRELEEIEEVREVRK